MRRTAAGVALALALCACQAAHPAGFTGSGAHVLRIGYVNDPSSLNPLFEYAQTQIDLCDLYTETLVGLNSKNELVPLLARRVPTRENGDVSENGLTITYHLRNARFADGVAFTSNDVLFTYRAILDPRNPVTFPDPYKRIASMTAPDAKTIVIRLKQAWAAATAELFAQSDFAYGILPAHSFDNDPGNLASSDWNQHPFGTGPFRVVRWDRGTQIILSPNTNAWRKPHLRSLVVKIYPDDTSRVVALRTHEIDVTTVEGAQALTVRHTPGVHLRLTPMNGEDFLSFQTQHTPLGDARVRRAISEAVNREGIRRDAMLDMNEPDTTEDPQMTWAFDPAIAPLPFDQKRADADLDAAGWHLQGGTRYKNGRPLRLDVAFMGTREYSRRVATLLQADLRVVGIDAELHGYTVTMFMGGGSSDVLHSGRFDIAITGFDNGSDPEESEQFTCADRSPQGSDSSRWCNSEYDRQFAVQRATLDRRIRKAAFYRMQHILHDSYAVDFLWTDEYHDALANNVSGWAPNMLYRYSNSEDWDVR